MRALHYENNDRHGELDDARQQTFMALDRLFTRSCRISAGRRTCPGADSARTHEEPGSFHDERAAQHAAAGLEGRRLDDSWS